MRRFCHIQCGSWYSEIFRRRTERRRFSFGIVALSGAHTADKTYFLPCWVLCRLSGKKALENISRHERYAKREWSEQHPACVKSEGRPIIKLNTNFVWDERKLLPRYTNRYCEKFVPSNWSHRVSLLLLC